MKKLTSLILTVILSITLFAGCGGTKDKDNDTQPTNTTTNEAEKKELSDTEVIEGSEEAENAARKRAGAADTFIVGTSELSGEFLPPYASSTYDNYIVNLMFDGLVIHDKEGNYDVLIADSYEVSEDNKTYTFKLKEDLVFSDGTPLTAKDVAFTYTVFCDPAYDGSRNEAGNELVGYDEYHDGDADHVEGIKVIDDQTISFTFKIAKPNHIEKLAYGIMPEHIYQYEKGKSTEIRDKMNEDLFIGNGRYNFVDYEEKQFAKFESNPLWFKGEPNIKNIIVKHTTVETMFQELEAGTIDFQTRVPSKEENKQQIENIGCLNINSYPDNGYSYIGFNLRDDRLADVKVRQALTYGFNRQAFVDVYFNGYASVCNTPLSQVSWAYPPQDQLNKYDYSPEKAKQLLEEAGWKEGSDGIREKDGKKLELNWVTYTESKFVETMIAMLISDWEKIGVKVTPNLVDWSTLLDIVYYTGDYDFDLYNMSWSLSIDPDATEIFHSKNDVVGGFNSTGLHDDEIDRLLEEGCVEFDPEKRAEIYQEWGLRMNEILPYMYISQSTEWDVSNNRVKNLDISPYCDWVYSIENLELEAD